MFSPVLITPARSKMFRALTQARCQFFPADPSRSETDQTKRD